MLKIKNLSKSFNKIPVLKDLNLELKKGDIVGILGGSGSGKSTLLRIIAGLEEKDLGELELGGKTSMMFQNYALFPHLNVEKNILFPLYDMDAEAKKRRLEELLAAFQIEEIAKKMTYEISGGQAQRVAFARAVASGASILLLDEPFSNLDHALKADLRTELKDMIKKSEITAILVTHDIEDAYFICDEIALLKSGELIAKDEPRTLYMDPKSSDVASFLVDLNIINPSSLRPNSELDKAFISWLKERNYIFSYRDARAIAELGKSSEHFSDEIYCAEVLNWAFNGAFYKIKLELAGAVFFMLVDSKAPITYSQLSFRLIRREHEQRTIV